MGQNDITFGKIRYPKDGASTDDNLAHEIGQDAYQRFTIPQADK